MEQMQIFEENFSELGLSKAISGLAQSEVPILIRNGAKIKSKDQWLKFLSDKCKLTIDQRHFSFSANLEIKKWWEISYQEDKETSYAYSKTAQPLHSDNAWFSDPAKINFFLLEKQAARGGHQTIYPITNIITDLRNKNPKLLDSLSLNKFVIKKGDSEYSYNGPIVDLDKNEIHWNYYRTIKHDKTVQNICDLFFDFLSIQEATNKNVYRLETKTGDCFCFNDLKMLHGREAFEVSENRGRILHQSMWKN